ncbi:MAG: tRNA threonylcarbamoyladenosine dehydratase [Firmicutes bacterium]|nr:tRNA threonylcarbamoyladenosine dehydratase [Bacillota bacterium]
MASQFDRTERLIGKEGLERLKAAHVAVFGIGGVGGFACEALARAGIGRLTLIDFDDVDVTNINRQIIALHSTVGRAKTEVMAERIADINPDCEVELLKMLYLPENADSIDLSRFDYVVDAIDNVSAKVELVVRCERLGVNIISAMGTGNKFDPTRFEVADIYKTSVCPLARVMRRELKARGVKHLKVVYSKEEAKKDGERAPASISFVPPVAGMILASELIKQILLL